MDWLKLDVDLFSFFRIESGNLKFKVGFGENKVNMAGEVIKKSELWFVQQKLI